MAIEPVTKITVIAHNTVEDDLVEAMYRLGTVHVDIVEVDDLLDAKKLSESENHEARGYSFAIVQIEFILGFLRRHATEKPGFLKTMIRDKYPMTLDDFANAEQLVDLDRLYHEVSDYERRFVNMKARKAKLEAERDELQYWADLVIPMEELHGEHLFALKLVRILETDFDAVTAELESEVPESSVEVVSRRTLWVSCLIIYYPPLEEELMAVLARQKAEIVTLPDIEDEPEERREHVEREIASIDRRREDLEEKVQGQMHLVSSLEVLREYMVNERRKIEITTSFGATQSTVAVEGWLAEDSVPFTADRLSAVAEELALEVSEPADEDKPPVKLKNPGWARPFELLVKMYGTPNRSEYDPTVVMAVSFSLFFGFCIGDFGYGLCLLVALYLLRRFLPLGDGAKDFMTCLMYGSVFAIVIGALTGSYFGIETDKLPLFLQKIGVLDPLNRTLLVMGVCIGIGFVHMLIGTGAEMHDNWKTGDKSAALIDQGLIFLLFVGVGIGAVLAFVGLIPGTVVVWMLLAVIIAMILLLGRSSKSIPGKLVNGLYETYGTVVGYISDAISYVRLFALGLATFIIGMVINIMAGLVQGIAPVIGIVLMLVILLVGHTFNVAINLLGAFVHPLRLEFVEFFGKFYDDGGAEFKPFGVESKVVMIKEPEGTTDVPS
ncbi:MAG: V-type ATP synthase subunit I [Actinobacteria bacterium]|nr:V-type ATP synthase subunit I [Actinomycetota bacterium]MBU1943335.1 V-type ATP synthase subunit I [Actinomycetota bacterium]MBU2686547.1 V-type ATP synthase subunit I [Actinomycetota bacterium]